MFFFGCFGEPMRKNGFSTGFLRLFLVLGRFALPAEDDAGRVLREITNLAPKIIAFPSEITAVRLNITTVPWRIAADLQNCASKVSQISGQLLFFAFEPSEPKRVAFLLPTLTRAPICSNRHANRSGWDAVT